MRLKRVHRGIVLPGPSWMSLTKVKVACRQNRPVQRCQVSDTWQGRDRRENGDGVSRVVDMEVGVNLT